jgi:hypothetical protein
LCSQRGGIQEFALSSGIIEEFLLQLGRQRVPLHDGRSPQASQDTFAFRFSAGARTLQRMYFFRLLVDARTRRCIHLFHFFGDAEMRRRMHGFVMIIGKPLLVVGSVVKLRSSFSNSRTSLGAFPALAN